MKRWWITPVTIVVALLAFLMFLNALLAFAGGDLAGIVWVIAGVFAAATVINFLTVRRR